ncbi:hypothetical protein D8674_008829 [Pyrus ussuriensis x Pyrus communis]|uniref:Uncharacterized protein n=1 Tax=Pyrus ussuriensis x Pyrus communis TaxID=2448454 RepID=A0A5N5I0V7_9ROSA|nr:hypothetical protein D8674_008829 [Pyrus ussuriensis x Pyrus communis]
MEPRPVNPVDAADPVAPRVSQAPTLSTSSVLLLVSSSRGHCCPRTPDETSASTTDASGSQHAKKNTQGPCRQLKMAKVTQVTNRCITIEFKDCTLAHNIGHIIQTCCPMQWKSWKTMSDKLRTKVCAQLSILTKTLDQTLKRRPGTYCKGMGNAWQRELRTSSSSQSKSEVTTLKAEVADLRTELASYKSHMSLIVQALS